MDGMPLSFFVRSIFLSTAVLALASCGQLNSAKVDVPGAKPSDTSGSTTTPPPSGPVVNSAGFFLSGTGDNNSKMVKYMHQADAAYGSDIGTTKFSSDCKIADGSAPGTDLLCVAEVEELDLYFNTFNLQYHVPSDMCTYVKVKPYWFYDYEAGKGPTVVSHEVSSLGVITDVINTVNGVAKCDYDHTFEAGANCCVGPYDHTVTTYNASNVPVSIVTTPSNWGGKGGNCAAGPGATLSGFRKQGLTDLPLSNIYYVAGTGLNDTLSITAPIEVARNGRSLYSNVWTSNFYKPSEHTGLQPIGLQFPAGIPAGNNGYLPSDTYEFSCLNAAEEVQQRIRLFIREWNEDGQLVEGGDPDTTGVEPVFGGQLNDRADWKDFGDLYPASSL